MKELNDIEYKKISALIEVYIPNYIKEFNDDKIDLMDCYEIGFVFAHDLGQFTRNYTQTTKRGLLTTNKG